MSDTTFDFAHIFEGRISKQSKSDNCFSVFHRRYRVAGWSVTGFFVARRWRGMEGKGFLWVDDFGEMADLRAGQVKLN